MPASAGPTAAPNFSRSSASPRCAGAVVDQNHADGAVHLGVRRLAEELRVLGVNLAREDALLVEFLRLVPQHEHDLALDVDAGVIVVVVLGGGDAVAGEHHAARQPLRARKS